MTVRTQCLRTEHVVGNDHYPIFIGFMTAGNLQSIAEAPAFALTTPHQQIAQNASASPVVEWQRPLDTDRVAKISQVFATATEIMPNAVLLAAPDPASIQVGHAGQGNLFNVAIAVRSPKPLVILDGQHRIAGMAAAQPHAEIPFVLLASHDQSALYQDSTFAKIFAQVTTTAEGLHPLHNEWLTYAFDLDKYDLADPSSGQTSAKHKKSMAAVIALCTSQHLDQARSIANPFFNRVAFNPENMKRKAPSPQIGPVRGGFQYDATTWESIIYSSYYGSKSIPAGLIPPDELALEIARAYEGLVACHQSAALATSVLLTQAGTTGGTGHKALQDGFVHGVLRYLAEHGAPVDWHSELQARGFQSTDWSAQLWAGSRTGEVQTLNKNIARETFGALLGGTSASLFLGNVSAPSPLDLNAYFTGAIGAGIEVQGRRVNAQNKKIRLAATDPRDRIISGQIQTRLNVGPSGMVCLGPVTPNVQSVVVKDDARPYERDWSYSNLKKGVLLTPTVKHSNPLKVIFEITFYGGVQRVHELFVTYV